MYNVVFVGLIARVDFFSIDSADVSRVAFGGRGGGVGEEVLSSILYETLQVMTRITYIGAVRVLVVASFYIPKSTKAARERCSSLVDFSFPFFFQRVHRVLETSL